LISTEPPASASAPPVLLVHGLGSSFEAGWRASGWIGALSDAGRTVLPFDLLGHGAAEAPHDPAAYKHLDRCVEAALPNEPVDAIGFSLGAQLLLRVAARDSERFRRLVVISIGASMLLPIDFEFLADVFESGVAAGNPTTGRFLQLTRGTGNDPRAIAACLRRGDEPLGAEELARIDRPTLVIVGDLDFGGPPDEMVAALPDATLRVLPGVDHFRAPNAPGCLVAALEFLGSA
jgi:pimeloyl-ACP methyl ester carboxylesterase